MWRMRADLSKVMEGLWLVEGDFNEILDDVEKSGGNRRDRRLIIAFQNMILEAKLHDLKFVGQAFTWSNQMFDGLFVKKK